MSLLNKTDSEVTNDRIIREPVTLSKRFTSHGNSTTPITEPTRGYCGWLGHQVYSLKRYSSARLLRQKIMPGSFNGNLGPPGLPVVKNQQVGYDTHLGDTFASAYHFWNLQGLTCHWRAQDTFTALSRRHGPVND